MSETPGIPPAVTEETEPFWAAAKEGRLVVERCTACEAEAMPPRGICRRCHNRSMEWAEVTGPGVVYSYTVNHRGQGAYQGSAPFVLAYVELEEGQRVMTNIVEADVADLAVGLPVDVVFHDTGDGSALPRFRPRKDQ